MAERPVVSLSVITRERTLLLNLLRAKYEPDTAAFVTTDACALLGHPEKYAMPLADKADWQKGCCCTARPWI